MSRPAKSHPSHSLEEGEEEEEEEEEEEDEDEEEEEEEEEEEDGKEKRKKKHRHASPRGVPVVARRASTKRTSPELADKATTAKPADNTTSAKPAADEMASATHEDSPKKKPATTHRRRRRRAKETADETADEIAVEQPSTIVEFLQANETADVIPAAGTPGALAELTAAESLPAAQSLKSMAKCPPCIDGPDLESMSIPGSDSEGACTPPRTGLWVWLKRGPQVPKGY